MEDYLKDMEFSIICKDGEAAVRLKGSIVELSALIAMIAVNDRNVKEIIKLAVIGLNAKVSIDELDEANDTDKTANH